MLSRHSPLNTYLVIEDFDIIEHVSKAGVDFKDFSGTEKEATVAQTKLMNHLIKCGLILPVIEETTKPH